MNGKKMYLVLAAIWFVLWGFLGITNFTFALSNVIMGVLAIAVGILIFLDR